MGDTENEKNIYSMHLQSNWRNYELHVHNILKLEWTVNSATA